MYRAETNKISYTYTYQGLTKLNVILINLFTLKPSLL